MPKKDWKKYAYKGKPDPLKPANRFMFILIILLFAGFIKAGLKYGWFDSIINYVAQ